MSNDNIKNQRETAIEAALQLAAEKGWPSVTMQAVARRAKIKLADLRELFADRYDILAAYGRMLDRRVLESMGEGRADEKPRDRLFEILMERFDALNDHRDGVCAILDTVLPDPKQTIVTLPHLCRSMGWMLDAAGIETSGLKGVAKVMGLMAIYADTLRTWHHDDSADLSKTMAALDKNLARAEKWAERFF